jgi:hypothetical protein
MGTETRMSIFQRATMSESDDVNSVNSNLWCQVVSCFPHQGVSGYYVLQISLAEQSTLRFDCANDNRWY